MSDIKGPDDLPDFSNSVPPTIDPDEQSKLDALLTTFYASRDVVNADEATVDQGISALMDWSAVTDHAISLAGPIISSLLTKANVPAVQHPSILKTALPQLVGIATAAPSARGGLITSLVGSLLPAL